MGATRRADGEYELPCNTIAVTDLQQIPSHKRSEARKRMELIDRAVQATLAGFTATPSDALTARPPLTRRLNRPPPTHATPQVLYAKAASEPV
ncbi:DUF535 family protein [Collimonas sp.]|uniref:DUF535 family protein n=1 Tax=Collimonas sp. TaxID=1963772 RepID=UPI0037BEEA5A